MSIFKRKQRSAAKFFLTSAEGYDTLCVSGYTSLDQNPEIIAGCRKIAELISSMTIYLMANTDKGDQRIINELSRTVDIFPSPHMTRKTWMDGIVMNLLLYGKGNAVVYPHTSNGYLEELEPISAGRVTFRESGRGYKIVIDGVEHDPANMLHFVHNPDKNQLWRGQGLTVALKDVAHNLRQAAETERGFMASKWKPSMVVKVDSLTDEFSSPKGREKLLDDYIKTAEAGEPWLIPAEQFQIEQIKPLSLADLAISDVVQLDKRSVAAILGVPPFVLGVGDYDAEAWNGFVSNTIRPIVRGIEQELTRKLLISPKWYWQFNLASLYSYDLQTTATVYSELYVRGIVTGNEVRNKISMQPMDGLDELVILENYIPRGKIGDQLKLKGDDANAG